MSIFDNNTQKEFELDFFAGKIKAAQADYDKANSEAYSGPGNGCDDYREVDPEVESKWKYLQRLKNEFKEKFHFSYESYEHDSNMPNNDLMTARQARALYKETVERDNTELNAILEKVKKAIIERKQDYCYVNTMQSYTKEKLEKLGYKITFISGGDDPRDGNSFRIDF